MKKLLFLFLLLPLFGWGQTNPFCGTFTTSAPISLTGVSNQTITGLSITGTQGIACIRLTNCDHIRIYNNILNGNATAGQDPNRFGVVTTNCHDIQVVYNNITNCSNGIYFTAFSGSVANMRADSNWMQNMQGPYPKGCAIQFNQISGAGCSASYNKIENLAGISAPQDNISCFQSNGTAASNIIIQDNTIYGSGVINASNSGIIMGDGGGSYVSAVNNIIVNAAHVCIGVVSGSNYTVYGNTMLTNSPTIINPVCLQISTCNNVNVQNNQAQNTRGPATYFTCTTFTNISNNFNATINPNILQPLPGCTVSPPNISFNPDTFIYHINQPISPATPINVGGAAVSFSISPLQSSGLNFSTTSGTLSGTPLSLLSQTVFTVSAVNATGQSSCHLVLTIVNIPPNIKYSPSSQVGTINVPIIPMPVINSAGAATSFTCSPSLPAGLILTSSGTVQGTPTVTIPSTNFVITGFNSGGNSSATINLTINPPLPARPSVSFSPSSYSFPVNSAIPTIHPINTGGAPSNPWSISPSLVSGLSFSTADGSIYGTPTATISSTPYLVTASNVSGSSSATVNIAVTALPPALPSFTYAPQSFNLTVNQSAILLAPSSTGGAVTSWSVLPALPSGLVLDGSTGILTGVGTAVTPQANYIITGSNITGSGHYTLTITIVPQGGTNNIRVGGFVAKFE